jgi:predicted metalloenzyme YecM
MFVDAMEHINITQFEIEKHCKRIQKYTTKKHLQYLKSKNKKIHHISKNMVNVFKKFNITMCDTFI